MKYILLTLVLTIGPYLSKGGAAEGEKIFNTRCGACHSIDKKLVGPALKGLADRRSEDWIIRFVRSSQTLIKSGDKDAVAVFNEFNKSPMPDHPDLTDQNIKDIIAFVKDAGAKPMADIGNPLNLKKPVVKKTNAAIPAYISDNVGLWTAVFASIILLIAVLYMLVVTNELK